MVAAEAEIHALLKACTFAAAHFDVGDDAVAHDATLTPNDEVNPRRQRPPKKNAGAILRRVERLVRLTHLLVQIFPADPWLHG